MKQDSKKEPGGHEAQEQALLARRDFLVGIAKWSSAVIGGIALGGVLGSPQSAEAVWVNRRGGRINGRSGGWPNGGGWINGGGGWYNIGGTWANAIGGGGWINRRGGGWVNFR